MDSTTKLILTHNIQNLVQTISLLITREQVFVLTFLISVRIETVSNEVFYNWAQIYAQLEVDTVLTYLVRIMFYLHISAKFCRTFPPGLVIRPKFAVFKKV